MRPGIRIEKQLVGIEAVAGVRLVRPVDTQSVDRARVHIGNVPMPDEIRIFRQHDALGFGAARGIE